MAMPSQKLLNKISRSRRVSLCINCFDDLPHQSFLSSCDHPTSLGNSISAIQLTITLDSVYSDFYHSMFSLKVFQVKMQNPQTISQLKIWTKRVSFFLAVSIRKSVTYLIISYFWATLISPILNRNILTNRGFSWQYLNFANQVHWWLFL